MPAVSSMSPGTGGHAELGSTTGARMISSPKRRYGQVRRSQTLNDLAGRAVLASPDASRPTAPDVAHVDPAEQERPGSDRDPTPVPRDRSKHELEPRARRVVVLAVTAARRAERRSRPVATSVPRLRPRGSRVRSVDSRRRSTSGASSSDACTVPRRSVARRRRDRRRPVRAARRRHYRDRIRRARPRQLGLSGLDGSRPRAFEAIGHRLPSSDGGCRPRRSDPRRCSSAARERADRLVRDLGRDRPPSS